MKVSGRPLLGLETPQCTLQIQSGGGRGGEKGNIHVRECVSEGEDERGSKDRGRGGK